MTQRRRAGRRSRRPRRPRADITGMGRRSRARAAGARSADAQPAPAASRRRTHAAGCPTSCTAPRARRPSPPRGRPRGEPPQRARRGGAQRRRTRIDSLDSLSVDIARMIDHDAAADLWDRYKRGERNVFTRKLYTMQGQQAFEEIRRKYRGDRDFMHTVDRYIARVRAAARRGLARRPRPGGGAHLSHLGDRQGLHHAGARGGTLRLIRQTDGKHRRARVERARFVLAGRVRLTQRGEGTKSARSGV